MENVQIFYLFPIYPPSTKNNISNQFTIHQIRKKTCYFISLQQQQSANQLLFSSYGGGPHCCLADCGCKLPKPWPNVDIVRPADDLGVLHDWKVHQPDRNRKCKTNGFPDVFKKGPMFQGKWNESSNYHFSRDRNLANLGCTSELLLIVQKSCTTWDV